MPMYGSDEDYFDGPDEGPRPSMFQTESKDEIKVRREVEKAPGPPYKEVDVKVAK